MLKMEQSNQGGSALPKSKDVRKAIAYLKSKVAADPAHPSVRLSDEDSPVLLDIGNGLVVAYVVDGQDSLMFVNRRDLRDHQLDVPSLHAIGLENLLQLSREKTRVQPYGNIFAVFLDGNFEASLLLLDPLWDKGLRHLFPGPYAAAIPARDLLAFGDASSTGAIEDLTALIGRTFPDGDHLLSDRIFTRDQTG